MTIYGTEKQGGCLLKIRGSLEGLKSAEKRIALYILDNPAEVISLTINQLAECCQSSYATVNRFCKKMGYSGYKELKSYLLGDVSSHQQDMSDVLNVTITPTITFEEISNSVREMAFKTLSDTFSILDIGMLEHVTDAILSAKQTLFIGTGNSGFSARYAYSKFFRIGLPCAVELDPTFRKMKVSLVQEGEIVFAISSSGRSAEILECAKIAKHNGATVISLSDFNISPLSKIADLNLYTTPRNVNAFSNIDMPLTIGQFAIIDILHLCCCKKIGESAINTFSKTKDAADSEKSY